MTVGMVAGGVGTQTRAGRGTHRSACSERACPYARAMPSHGRENVLGSPVALPRRALAGSAAGKALEALTLAGLVLLVPRALGAADYGGFAVALAVATGIATATGIGGPALFARVLGAARRRRSATTSRARSRCAAGRDARRAGRSRSCSPPRSAGALLAPGDGHARCRSRSSRAAARSAPPRRCSRSSRSGSSAPAAWSLRYPLENGVIVAGALVLYPLAGLDGAIAAIALGAAAALALGLASASAGAARRAAGRRAAGRRRCASRGCRPPAAR